MGNKQIQKKSKNICLVLIITMLILFCLFSITTPLKVFADTEETITYSNVLDDLQKDENFNIDDYPLNEKDYSLQVIQIAESEDHELFIYVYNPSSKVKELRATSINISINANEGLYVADDDEGMSYINYKLTYLNNYSVFYKYKVDNFTVKNDETRYYNISNIYRAFDYLIDESAEDGQEISEVGNRVGKVWTVQTIDGAVQYACKEVETIEITSKYVGFVRYYNGWKFYDSSCDSHYVAFSTDKEIDQLIEAEVYFTDQQITEYYVLNVLTETLEGEVEEKYKFLNYTQKASNSPGGLFGNSYTWERIESIDEFKNGLKESDINLTDEAETGLQDKKWVLRFSETDYLDTRSLGQNFIQYTKVKDISILRLKFETDGEVYNLGVVDNKMTGSGEPSNVVKLPAWLQAIKNWFDGLGLALQIIIGVVLVLLSLAVLYFIVRFFIVIFKGIKKLFGGE